MDGQAYSEDLRVRVLGLLRQPLQAEAAKLFEVSVASVVRWSNANGHREVSRPNDGWPPSATFTGDAA